MYEIGKEFKGQSILVVEHEGVGGENSSKSLLTVDQTGCGPLKYV